MVRIFALLLSVCFGLAAQTVNINVPAVNSKGTQVSVGQVFISWHSFLDNSGKLVQGSQKTVPVANGMISTSLIPSDNAGLCVQRTPDERRRSFELYLACTGRR